MSTGQLIVTIAAVGLLGALHLVLRAARAPAGVATVGAPEPRVRRLPLRAALVIALLAALAFAGVALVISVLDDDEETVTPTTQTTPTVPTTTTTTTTTAAPPPPQPPPPPPPPIEAPAGTALIARVVTDPRGGVSAARNRAGKPPAVTERETGVYAVMVPGLSPALRKRAAIRARPASAQSGVRVSARKVGPEAEFVVFTRDAQTGDFAESAFEFAVFLPEEDVEGAGGEDENGRRKLPPTK